MEVLFESELPSYPSSLPSLFTKIAERTFELLEIKENYEISVTLVDEEEIRRINREYRNIDRETDVISFAFNDDTSALGKINSLEIPKMLGDIYICLGVAVRQSESYNHSLERELSFLFVHGLLHLLGYDHQSKEEEEVMFPLQDKILSSLKIERN